MGNERYQHDADASEALGERRRLPMVDARRPERMKVRASLRLKSGG